jgi:hypothetical protein
LSRHVSNAGHTSADESADSVRLIRLLTMIGTPTTAGETVERTLAALAEILRCEVVGVVEARPDRLILTESSGSWARRLRSGDRWPLGWASA